MAKDETEIVKDIVESNAWMYQDAEWEADEEASRASYRKMTKEELKAALTKDWNVRPNGRKKPGEAK